MLIWKIVELAEALVLYILAYNPHNVRDTFIYYKRQIVGENLKIL